MRSISLILILVASAAAQQPTREAIIAEMKPYEGASHPGVDGSTLTGKVMAGYQGWFTAEGDGAGMGWRHFTNRGQFRPGQCNIDLWPDVSELDADEKIATPFKFADGSPAFVFSSHNKKTVLRHFQWMKDYGLDGVFVQRFVVETQGAAPLGHCNTVMANCREGANLHGRCYAAMYDLSGLRRGGIDRCIEDWKLLVDRMKLGRDDQDKAYLRHGGKPVVAVWGIGFNDGRAYTLADCDRLIEFLKNDPTYGGNTVMIGIPTYWRTQQRDTITDAGLHATLLKADIFSPWLVGRFGTPQAVARHAREQVQPDIAWCKERRLDYAPCVTPGFSWFNLGKTEFGGAPPLNQIPRQKGKFYWSQISGAAESGAKMIYVAMFDEMDEGTAIFKCSNTPPAGPRLCDYEGLPTDHYLWLTGKAGRMLRGEIPLSKQIPSR